MSTAPAPLPTQPRRCRFGLYEFDFHTGELRRDGHVIKLSPQPARVLALLLSRPGEVVLREELRAHLWGDDTFVDFERGLNFCILQVRGALGDSSDNPRFVQTVPRKGYRFIAPVAVTSVPGNDLRPHEEPPSPASDLLPSPQPPSAAAKSAATHWLTAGAVLLLLGSVIWLVTGMQRGQGPGVPAERIRVAVLPVVNLTADSSADYLADALTDELISELGQVSPSRLGVIARTSAMTYRNTSKSVAEIGRELNVSFVVESSVRREGRGLQIGSRLIPAADQTPVAVWSELFGGTNAPSRESQTGAAIRVAHLVALKLVPNDPADERQHSTSNLAAWDAFLQGRVAMNHATPDEVRQALRQFETAVSADPSFAPGWAKLAEARHLLVMMGALAPNEAYPQAREAARRALDADRRLADAHLAQGLIDLWYDWRPEQAAAAFAEALTLNGSNAAAHHDYAWALLALGRPDEAVSHITIARDLDPLSARANNDIGWLRLQLRQPAEAAKACQHTLAIQPSSLEAQACLERAYAQRGLDEAALEAARRALPAGNGWTMPADGGDAAKTLTALWRWRLDRLEEASRSRWINPYTLAVNHILVGNHLRAIEQLEAAADQRVGMMVFLDRDPALDPLRAEPRYQALLSRIRGARR